MKIKRALISVTDKRGLDKLAEKLSEAGVEIIASGGTAETIRKTGIEVTGISELTGFPEMMDGRVKTLHPIIHGGILADRNRKKHLSEAEDMKIGLIDLVVVNLYRFREAAADKDLEEGEIVEQIDIGGPTLVRSAAKNFHSVAVVVDPGDYDMIAENILSGGGEIPLDQRRRLASKAFHHTASYDAAVSEYFDEITGEGLFPESRVISFRKWRPLRYGENPHLKAALYRKESGKDTFSDFEQLQGKELSFNNIMDMFAAFNLARDLGENSCTVNKHMNPCGAAACESPSESFIRARKTDTMSAFGSVVAVNGVVDADLAEAANQGFVEVMLSKGFTDSARDLFMKKKNIRLIVVPPGEWDRDQRGMDVREIGQLVLVQERDSGFPELEDLELVTSRKPDESESKALRLAWKVVKHIRSNAVVICDEWGTLGIGAGQMSRVDSCRIAVQKAKTANLDLAGASAGSDAFFPFPDGVEVLVEAGVRSVIQPGGSIRDKKVIAAAEEMGIAMMLTGVRHFKH